MIEQLIQLIILFMVIFDPFVSFSVFCIATQKMEKSERYRTAFWALVVASAISYSVLLFGQSLLTLLSTSIKEFSVAGGIILGILGIKMALGDTLTNVEGLKNNTGIAIASIIGTPLLTGPAAITAIIISTHDYGVVLTASAVTFVLAFTAIMFLMSERISKLLGKTLIQVISTILGLITLSWGVKFVISGLA